MSRVRKALSPFAAALWLGTAGRALADAPTSDRILRDDDQERVGASSTPQGSSDDDCEERKPPRPVAMSALGTAAVFLPGALVHGSGHLMVGDSKTGLRLLALEGAGLGLLAAGFVPIVATGASRRLVGPGALLSVAGVGLFTISLLADLYGVVAPVGGVGAPSRVAPALQTALGYRYVYDPVFAYRQFMVYEIDYRAGAWRVHPSAWFALDDTNSRVRSLFTYRVSGPSPKGRPPSSDGSFLDIETALTRHAFTSDKFATTTGEIAVAGRLDMARIGPSLEGSFAEMSFGYALQAYAYDVRGTTADVGELLLARFGYGMYVGWPGAPRGEVTVYYDHRHDGFAAGLKIPGLGSGVVGHFGAEGRLFVSEHWGIAAEAVAGSAYVTGLSVLFRHGEPL